jgi:hypothetical protein
MPRAQPTGIALVLEQLRRVLAHGFEHAIARRFAGDRKLRVVRRQQCVAGVVECRAERVADGLEDGAALPRDELAQQRIVTRERDAHLGRMALPEPRAAFDIREEQRDRSVRTIRHRAVPLLQPWRGLHSVLRRESVPRAPSYPHVRPNGPHVGRLTVWGIAAGALCYCHKCRAGASPITRTTVSVMNLRTVLALAASCMALVVAPTADAQCPAALPAQGAPPPGPLPVFPADNWWNLDVSAAPVDVNSASYIAFINNGGMRRLHPDFGGEASPGSVAIYGMPYAVVAGSTPKQAVTFGYWDESDGVDYATGRGVPFYPLPAQAISQQHWVEGGAPASVDQRGSADRHLIVIDCTNKYLYELYNVWYDSANAKWYAGSGAFFDMNTNHRRPDGWTSADAAGLAIFPGLVRYDEAWNDALPEIGHAFRVTVRATNGYVYPASHRAGSTAGALPMGARLRLKTNVGGTDPALRTSDPHVRKIFRAMQKHGLIVADNGSDMYITGTFDTRWNNDLLNPAFALLTASDFEVLRLGWNPPPPSAAALAGVSASPASVVGGSGATGTVTLTSAAPASGAVVTLASGSPSVGLPAGVTVAAGASAATFAISTSSVATTTLTTLTASYDGVTKTTTFTVNPPAPAVNLVSLKLHPTTVVGGTTSTGTLTLSAPAPAGGIAVALVSDYANVVRVPASVLVPAGAMSKTFTITTNPVAHYVFPTILATYRGVTKYARLTVTRR